VNWTIYVHLRLHMVAFVLTCAMDSIWENFKRTFFELFTPTTTYGHYAESFQFMDRLCWPFLSLNYLTIFSYEEPLLSTPMLSSVIWPGNSSNITDGTGQFQAFSSLDLFGTAFLQIPLKATVSLQRWMMKLSLLFCPPWLNLLWTATTLCPATPAFRPHAVISIYSVFLQSSRRPKTRQDIFEMTPWKDSEIILHVFIFEFFLGPYSFSTVY